ncbi:MAG: flagellar biosynthesis protein FlhF [Gammaproteobacteria bacterium]
MKIKRYFAPDIRQAIKQVREEQGPDAVILSNQSVNGGVEIVAAVDYDETLFKGDKLPAPQPGNLSRSSANRVDVSANRYTGNREFTAQDNSDSGLNKESPSTTSRKTRENIVWSQDPTLVDMRRELNSLRGMLENQLSSLAWGDMSRRFPMAAELAKRLTKLGITPSLCQGIIDSVNGQQDSDQLWHQALQLLEYRIPTADEEILSEGGIFALIGPTGVGKTTTAAKLAARFALRHGNRHVALITIDNYRVGAYEQLRTYGRILDIPVKMAESREELQLALDDLYDRRLILIDTAGMGQHDSHLLEQLSILSDNRNRIRKSLVLSTTTNTTGIEDILRAFSPFEANHCIFTKLDEATSLGGAISVSIKHGLPISYISDGQRVPEDLHIARAPDLINKSVEIMKSTEPMLDEEFMTMPFGGAAINAHV